MNHNSLRDTIENAYRRSSRYKRFTNEEDRDLDLSDTLETVRTGWEWFWCLTMKWLDTKDDEDKGDTKRVKREETLHPRQVKEFRVLMMFMDSQEYQRKQYTLNQWLSCAFGPIFEAKLVDVNDQTAPKTVERFTHPIPRLTPCAFQGAHRMMMLVTRLIEELGLPTYITLANGETKSITETPLSTELIKTMKEGFIKVVNDKMSELVVKITHHVNESDRFEALGRQADADKEKAKADKVTKERDQFEANAKIGAQALARLAKTGSPVPGSRTNDHWTNDIKLYENELKDYSDALVEHKRAVRECNKENQRVADLLAQRADLILHARNELLCSLKRYFSIDGWHLQPHVAAIGFLPPTTQGLGEEADPTSGLESNNQLVGKSAQSASSSNTPSIEFQQFKALSEADQQLERTTFQVRAGVLEEVEKETDTDLKEMGKELARLIIQNNIKGGGSLEKEIEEQKAVIRVRVKLLEELGRSATDFNLQGLLANHPLGEDENDLKTIALVSKIKADTESRAFKREQFEYQKEQDLKEQEMKESQQRLKALQDANLLARKTDQEVRDLASVVKKVQDQDCVKIEADFLALTNNTQTLDEMARDLKDEIFSMVEQESQKQTEGLSGPLKKELDRVVSDIAKEEGLLNETTLRFAIKWKEWTAALENHLEKLTIVPSTTTANHRLGLELIESARTQSIQSYEKAERLAKGIVKKKDLPDFKAPLVRKILGMIAKATGQIRAIGLRAGDIIRSLQRTSDRLEEILLTAFFDPRVRDEIYRIRQLCGNLQGGTLLDISNKCSDPQDQLKESTAVLAVIDKVAKMPLPTPGQELTDLFKICLGVVSPGEQPTQSDLDAIKKTQPLKTNQDPLVDELFNRVAVPVWKANPLLVKDQQPPVDPILKRMTHQMDQSFGPLFEYNKKGGEKVRRRVLQLYCLMVSGLKASLDPAIDNVKRAKELIDLLGHSVSVESKRYYPNYVLEVLSLLLTALARMAVCHKVFDYQHQFICNMQILSPGLDLSLDSSLSFMFDKEKVHRAINSLFNQYGGKAISKGAEKLSLNTTFNGPALRMIQTILTAGDQVVGHQSYKQFVTSLMGGIQPSPGVNGLSICKAMEDAVSPVVDCKEIWDMDLLKTPLEKKWVKLASGTINETFSQLDNGIVTILMVKELPEDLFPEVIERGRIANPFSSEQLNLDNLLFPTLDRQWMWKLREVFRGDLDDAFGTVTSSLSGGPVLEGLTSFSTFVVPYRLSGDGLVRLDDTVQANFFYGKIQGGREVIVANSRNESIVFALC